MCSILRRTQAGASKLTLLVFGSLLAAVCVCRLPHHSFLLLLLRSLRISFKQVIKVASVDTDEEIRRKLMVFIKQYQMPVDPEDLRIERTDDTMKISLKYKEVFYVTYQGKRLYDSHVRLRCHDNREV